MGFRTGAYAKIWEVKEGQGNYTDVRLSISRKNKEGEYEQDFQGYVRLIGEANKLDIAVKDTIKVGDCDVTSRYDKVKQTTYTNYAIFTAEKQENKETPTAPPARPANISEMQPLDEDLPF